MAIKKKIKEKIEEMEKDGAVRLDVQQKAVAAILGGADSDEWVVYMSQFAEDDADLKILMPEDNGDPNNFQRNLARAYLVGNGNCGAASPGIIGGGLDFGVDAILGGSQTPSTGYAKSSAD